MSREHYETELRQSLSQLETCLETPLVAGELPSWAISVQGAFALVGPMLLRQIEELHAEEFAEIGDQDPGLLTRVERLKDEDREILEHFTELSRRAERLSEVARRIEPDEGRVEQDSFDLVEMGLRFVLRVRKQEVAITTWLLEAFDRDRGVVD